MQNPSPFLSITLPLYCSENELQSHAMLMRSLFLVQFAHKTSKSFESFIEWWRNTLKNFNRISKPSPPLKDFQAVEGSHISHQSHENVVVWNFEFQIWSFGVTVLNFELLTLNIRNLDFNLASSSYIKF